MARLFSSGFEVASDTNGHEWANASVSSAGRSTAVKRTGTGSGRVDSLVTATQAGWGVQISSAVANGPFYLRFYLRVDTAPSADNCIAAFIAGANVTSTSVNDAQIRLTSTGTLRLFAANSAVGSASAALSTGTWYRVELEVDTGPASGSKILRAYLDGAQFAGTDTSTDVGGTVSGIVVGGNLTAEGNTTGDWYFDDVACNDSAGSQQNGLPGPGKIIALWPDAAGDSHQWLDTAGSAGSSNNYQLVDETGPNDATDLVQSNTLNDTDLYNIQASGIGSADTVNVVHVQLRRRNDVADTATAVAAAVAKTSGGTIAVTDSYIPNSTVWRSGGDSTFNYLPFAYTAYVDPDGSAWTQATLDTMQAGCRITAGSTNRIQVSTVWVTVDYTPASVFAAGPDAVGLTDAAAVVAEGYRGVDSDLGLTDAAAAVAEGYRGLDSDLGLTDALTAALTFDRPADSALGLTDAAAAAATRARDAASAVDMTDAASAQLTEGGQDLTDTIADNLGISDVAATAVSLVAADTADLSDAAARVMQTARALTETFSLTDAVTAAADRATGIDSNLGLTDTLTADLEVSSNPEDTLVLTDALTPAASRPRSSASVVSLIDGATAMLSYGHTVGSEIGLTDTLTAQFILPRSVVSLLDVSDDVYILKQTYRQQAGSVGLTDTIGAQRGAAAAPADTAGLLDTIDVQFAHVITAARHSVSVTSTAATISDTTP